MKKLTKVNEAQYWQVIGLLALAKKANKELKQIELAIADILGIEKDDINQYGHVSDAVYGYEEYDANELLKREDIKLP